MKIIMGIDPSLAETGYCIINENNKIVTDVIKSSPSGKNPIDELMRIKKIVNNIKKIVCQHKPSIVCIENMAFMARNTTSLIQLGALNFFIRMMVDDLKIKFIMIAPCSLKKFITGKGNSPKDNMLLETYKRYGVSFSNNNLCDAFGLAKIGQNLLNNNIKLSVPQSEVIGLIKKQL